MKALVRTLLEPGGMELLERDIPQIKDDEVLIKIKAVGVCGTDIHIYHGRLTTGTGVVIGHELAGEIVQVGSEVTDVKIGDRVVSRLNIGVCGVCRACLSGNPQMCEHRACPGHWVDGAFAEYMKIEAKQVLKFSDSLSYEEAAFVEPMACVAHGLLERAKVYPEDVVVIYGPGPIGLIAMQMAKINGASKVIVVGTDNGERARLPLARKLGADLTFNSNKDDVVKNIMELTNGQGADLFVDCSGSASAINAGIRMLRRQGRMAVIGLPGKKEMNVEWLTATQKSLQVIFSYSSSPLSWNLCLSMLERKAIDVAQMITHRVRLEDFKEVFESSKQKDVIKAMIIME